MDSEDTSCDDRTRNKRAPEDEIFGKSKKLSRTPSKKVGNEDKLEKVIEMIQNLSITVTEMREEQKEYRKEIRELREENIQIKQENVALKQQIQEIERRVDNLEKEKRRKNVVIQGLEVNTNNQNILKEEVEDFMKSTLKINTEIKGARKLSKKVILVEMKNTTDKEDVMKNKSKLKEVRNTKIYINDDMSKNEREIQGKIRQKAKEEATNGKNVKIGFQKLIINEEEWVWNRETEIFEKKGRQKILPKN